MLNPPVLSGEPIYRVVGKGLKNMRPYYKNEPILWVLYYFSITKVL